MENVEAFWDISYSVLLREFTKMVEKGRKKI